MENIKIERLLLRENKHIEELGLLWKNSVQFSHYFLSQDDIEKIRKQMLYEIETISQLLVALEKGTGIVGFLGIEKKHINLLYIHPDYMRRGLGSFFVNHSKLEYQVETVDVYKDNKLGLGFYDKMGFKIIGEREKDHYGNNFPMYCLKHIGE